MVGSGLKQSGSANLLRGTTWPLVFTFVLDKEGKYISKQKPGCLWLFWWLWWLGKLISISPIPDSIEQADQIIDAPTAHASYPHQPRIKWFIKQQYNYTTREGTHAGTTNSVPVRCRTCDFDGFVFRFGAGCWCSFYLDFFTWLNNSLCARVYKNSTSDKKNQPY